MDGRRRASYNTDQVGPVLWTASGDDVRLTRATNYALRALASLARGDGAGNADLKSLSDELAAPSAFLGKTLQALAKAGLVSGSRGAKGGYRLARSPDEIPVRDIVEAVEGGVRLANCTAPESKCGRDKTCAAGRFWNRLQDRINEALASETLASLLEDMHVSRNRSR